MTEPTIFRAATDGDAALATEVAALAGVPLRPEWVEGIAANARLMQRHLDTLDGRTP